MLEATMTSRPRHAARIRLFAAFVVLFSVLSYGDYLRSGVLSEIADSMTRQLSDEQDGELLMHLPLQQKPIKSRQEALEDWLREHGSSSSKMEQKQQDRTPQILLEPPNDKKPPLSKKHDYLSHRFQVGNNPSCRNDLIACDIVYDSECFHKCEREVFHKIESCLVKAYPLLQRAQQIPAEHSTACLLYDADGYLANGVFDLISKDFPEQLKTVAYNGADRPILENKCYETSKREDQTLCFNIKREAKVSSTANACGGTCVAADNLPQVINDIQDNLSHTWGPFHKQRQDTVVLIDRVKDSERTDARSFRHLPILEAVLRPSFNLKIYDGSTPSFSPETAALFASAKVVIGYHGAGFANLLFSHTNSNTVAIELFARGCSYEQYFNQRIAKWGFKWKQLVLGKFEKATGKRNQNGLRPCKWIDGVSYNQTEIGIILREVLTAFEDNS